MGEGCFFVFVLEGEENGTHVRQVKPVEVGANTFEQYDKKGPVSRFATDFQNFAKR